jgi:hypothetical protein
MWEAHFAFHISVAHARVEGGAKLCRHSLVERAVGTLVVVHLLPVCQLFPHIAKGAEPACIETLVAQPPMEALNMAVLHWLARLYVDQADLPVLGPAQHPARLELWAVAPPEALGRMG